MDVDEEDDDDEIPVVKQEHKLKKDKRSINTQTNFSLEEIEEFFLAIENGSLERLQELFNEKINADPNMTRFAESLLMTAIRMNQNEIADYLIDQLAVNVHYTADLREFRMRSRVPVRERRLSCRELAYEKGMMELVDLIDLTSDDVKPNVKRYLRSHLQSRLSSIHDAYVKRLEDQKHTLFQKQNRGTPTESIVSSVLPSISCRSPKSRIEKTVEDLDKSNYKSIDETGKKTFRFSNYTLRFRLMEIPETKNKTTESPPLKSNVPTLPTISLFAKDPVSLQTTNNKFDRSIGDNNSLFSTHTSMFHSIRRPTLPQIIHTDNKSTITTSTGRLSPKQVHQNKVKYSYIRRSRASNSQPRRLIPVTLKSPDT